MTLGISVRCATICSLMIVGCGGAAVKELSSSLLKGRAAFGTERQSRNSILVREDQGLCCRWA
jgi:hypothetical protein